MQRSVVIVGGGVMGAATACFLARDHGAQVTVLERDPTYARASSALSASSIRQQFTTPVNIALSRWSLSFLRRLGDELGLHDERPHIGLVEPGYLYLATPAGESGLRANHALQTREGAEVVLLTPTQLRDRFGWLEAGDLALGSLGVRGEGWFDGPALMQAFRRRAIECGAQFVVANVRSFDTHGAHVRAVLADHGRRFEASAVVLSAGAWTAALAIGLGVCLPVVARKRDVFVFESAAVLRHCPLVIDPSGVWFRPEGTGFITGAPPRQPWPGDPDEPPLEAIDHALFDEVIWPTLARRVPAFEPLRLRSAWAGYYEMNLFDANGLAGALPGWDNVFTACGFSGHGMQQAPAVGCALAALVTGGETDAPSLDALSPRRVVENRPLRESNVI